MGNIMQSLPLEWGRLGMVYKNFKKDLIKPKGERL
jgi:hypothetical protein